MTPERKLLDYGIRLYLPLDRGTYDFAYRQEALSPAQRAFVEELFSGYALKSIEINGYINCRVDLLSLHLAMGFDPEVVKRIRSEKLYEDSMRRGRYLIHLLKPFEQVPNNIDIGESLRKLLQMLHFPMLYYKTGSLWCAHYLEWTLEMPIRKLSIADQNHIRKISLGITECP